MSVKTYNPKDITIIAGYQQLTGFSEDDMIEVKPRGDGIVPYDGADGEVGRSIDPNNCLEITVTLAQTSASNDVLSAFYTADKNTGNGMFPFVVKDLSGTTVISATQAWVLKYADSKIGRKIDTRQWTIQTGQADVNIGGGSES
ncbi:phage structural protein [Pectinatus frisingensis]|uniref:phage structural protein n=1 Tax=Pectinatus frisingensis TaxID=865 RepID=UPI0018C752DD|nr:phage protein [Pectinatus frisingensis]